MDTRLKKPADRSHPKKSHKNPPAPTKLRNFKESLKTVTMEYCKESSISGLKYLVDDNIAYIERVIWKITLIGALVCSVALIWSTFERYYRAPLVLTQMPDGVPVSKIIFPAVGICTNNRISKRAALDLAKNLMKAERNANYSEQDMLSLLRGLGQLYNMQPASGNTVKATELHDALGNYDVNELLKNCFIGKLHELHSSWLQKYLASRYQHTISQLTPKCEDMLLRCAWNDSPKNCSELFDFRLTMDGYCCTFNYLRNSDTRFETKSDSTRSIDMYKFGNKSGYDFDEGLKVLMRLDETDDFYYNIPLRGAKLQFSDAYDFPDAPSGSFAMQIISPAVQMTVSMAASFTTASRDIQHVAVKLRRCLFYDESSYLSFYTHSDCVLKCRMLFLLDKCNCTPFNIPKMDHVRTCDMRDVRCLTKYYIQSINVRPDIEPIAPELELELTGGGVACPMCFPTCSKTAYGFDFYNVKIYPDRLNAVPDSDRDNWVQGANFTGTSIVHVKHGREVADCYGQNVVMKWFDLFSNIGSTCGFVTGFSFVSILEFVYFYTIKLFRNMEMGRRRNHIVKTIEHHEAPKFEPVGRYRPIYWNELTGSTGFTQHLPID